MMKVVSISGSPGIGLASTALQEVLAPVAPPLVLDLASAVAKADALIVAVPEYMRTLPGGFKNALDWLVSRPELIGKTIAIAHASHRGDEMLGHRRWVLETVSTGFRPDIFLREEIVHRSPEERAAFLAAAQTQAGLCDFLQTLAKAPPLQA